MNIKIYKPKQWHTYLCNIILRIAFLMAAGCIIYIKQMDETEDELDNFKILRRIGFTYTDMSKGLLLKLHLILDYRFLLLLLHALFAALAFMKLLGNVSMSLYS